MRLKDVMRNERRGSGGDQASEKEEEEQRETWIEGHC